MSSGSSCLVCNLKMLLETGDGWCHCQVLVPSTPMASYSCIKIIHVQQTIVTRFLGTWSCQATAVVFDALQTWCATTADENDGTTPVAGAILNCLILLRATTPGDSLPGFKFLNSTEKASVSAIVANNRYRRCAGISMQKAIVVHILMAYKHC